MSIRDIRLRATDGFELAATLYEPPDDDRTAAVVLVAPASGVKRRYYDKYARFLADSGLATVTFDYRGIGDSRPRSLRGFEASLSDWAEKDVAGVIDWIIAQRAARRLLVVGHSIGGQLIGLAPNNDRVDALLAVAAQSGYWGWWSGSRKLFMWSLWHVLMPGLTPVFSYFPSKKLGLSEDLPAGVARQWARWGRHPDYIVDDDGKPLRDGFRRFTGPIRSYSFTDDIHAPRAAVESMIRCYERASKEWRHLSPPELGLDAIGHFGFFREPLRATLWKESVEWFRQQAPDRRRSVVAAQRVSEPRQAQ